MQQSIHDLRSPVQFSSVQSLSHVQLFAIPWTAACQASLSISNTRRLLKLMSMESVMPQPGIKPMSPAVQVWSLNLWTARDITISTLPPEIVDMS